MAKENTIGEEMMTNIIADMLAEAVPKTCRALDQVDAEKKYGVIGATIQTYLSSLVNYCLYGDYAMKEDTADSLIWQKRIAEDLVDNIS